MHSTGEKLAGSGVVGAWAGWFLSHLDVFNAVLQPIALLCAIAASIAAALYHFRKWWQMGRSRRP